MGKVSYKENELLLLNNMTKKYSHSNEGCLFLSFPWLCESSVRTLSHTGWLLREMTRRVMSTSTPASTSRYSMT